MDWIVELEHFRSELGKGGSRFFVGLAHGTMRVELYRPAGADHQTPHAQDELYIVLQGSGTFSKAGVVRTFRAGDVIFVEAQTEHRFETFSDDFETWVIFWGPEGGEEGAI
jgi:mannose-6-phosphate isomerase-like protein (cupin superfamily)